MPFLILAFGTEGYIVNIMWNVPISAYDASRLRHARSPRSNDAVRRTLIRQFLPSAYDNAVPNIPRGATVRSIAQQIFG